MTKKEKEPKTSKSEREKTPENLKYNPDITEENKQVLNNQSAMEKKEGNLKDRKKPVDYTGEDLDIPKMDQEKFNQTVNRPEDTERGKRPKRSANSEERVESGSETVYTGKKAEKYKDPSKK